MFGNIEIWQQIVAFSLSLGKHLGMPDLFVSKVKSLEQQRGDWGELRLLSLRVFSLS